MLPTLSKTSGLPGIAVCALAVPVSLLISRFVPGVGAATAAVALGTALASTGAVRAPLRPGLAFVSKRVLRAAVVLLGLQIAVPQVLALGWRSLAVVAVSTGLTFVLTPPAGRRLGLSPGTSLLVATGVSICGASAIAAMHDSTDSTDDEAAGAIAVVVLYGSAAIVVLPLLASWLGLPPDRLGVWTGAAVHEVAQVAAIGAATGVLATAVTVKLARVVLLAPIVAVTTSLRRLDGARETPAGTAPSGSAGAGRPPIVPLFVAGFLAAVAVRSTGLLPTAVTDSVPALTNALLAAALFALGTGIDLRKLLRRGRVMALGAISTGLIAATSLAAVSLLG
ncbi:YeiH family protein [Nonomuraea phyllanthi]|uniref:YeiH family protein n=1 Tax=Nonomuraea phyllanthi TaxID=2219224 RepID=UPI001D0139D3|nr:putative sulfate exporter family transporter [Nonomuraea phyllanthi]